MHTCKQILGESKPATHAYKYILIPNQPLTISMLKTTTHRHTETYTSILPYFHTGIPSNSEQVLTSLQYLKEEMALLLFIQINNTNEPETTD